MPLEFAKLHRRACRLLAWTFIFTYPTPSYLYIKLRILGFQFRLALRHSSPARRGQAALIFGSPPAGPQPAGVLRRPALPEARGSGLPPPAPACRPPAAPGPRPPAPNTTTEQLNSPG